MACDYYITIYFIMHLFMKIVRVVLGLVLTIGDFSAALEMTGTGGGVLTGGDFSATRWRATLEMTTLYGIGFIYW